MQKELHKMQVLDRAPEKDYPRVLVVNGEPFWRGSATGITMSDLFKGWPSEHLACLYISQIIPDTGICVQYWKLTLRDLRSVCRIIGTREYLQEVALKTGDGMSLALRNSRTAEEASKIFHKLRKSISGQSVREIDTYQLSPAMLRALQDFSPQVIYSMLGSNAIMQLIIDLAQYFEIPIVPHFMDDWISTLYQTSVLKNFLRNEMQRRLAIILERSPVRLVIGDAMGEEYTQRYGGEFVPFMAAVEPEQLEMPVVFLPLRDKIRMVYAGGLHLNRWRSLIDIAMALKSLWHEGLRAEVLVYTQPQFYREAEKLEIPPVMHFVSSISSEQVFNVLREADIVLHVESFDHKSRDYARYSVSTKIPQAMAAARPIFAYGPGELASIRYVQSSQTGIAVIHQNQKELQIALKKLITSVSLREQLGEMGRQIAVHKHNAMLQRENFREILAGIACHD